MITQFIATTETAVPHGAFFWRILLTAPCVWLMLVFGFTAIIAFFTWLGGKDVSKEVEENINSAFSGFGKVLIVHFILTILATLFFEKTETTTCILQMLETILIIGLCIFTALVHSSENSK